MDEREYGGGTSPRPAYGAKPRKHMGTATSDPEYLPPTDSGGHIPPNSSTLRVRQNEHAEGGPASAHGPHRGRDLGPRRKHGEIKTGRYLSTPHGGKRIFTTQRDRQQRRMRHILAVLILAAIALALVWFFLLR